jgi:two-component system, sensor histidine kinase
LGIARLSLEEGGKMMESDVRLLFDCATSMQRVSDEVLDISRFEHGRIKLENIPFELRSLLVLIVSSFEITCRNKGVTLDLKVDDSTIQTEYFSGDPYRLRQILTNLLSNSIKV